MRRARELGRGEDAARGLDHEEERHVPEATRDRLDESGLLALREHDPGGPHPRRGVDVRVVPRCPRRVHAHERLGGAEVQLRPQLLEPRRERPPSPPAGRRPRGRRSPRRRRACGPCGASPRTRRARTGAIGGGGRSCSCSSITGILAHGWSRLARHGTTPGRRTDRDGAGRPRAAGTGRRRRARRSCSSTGAHVTHFQPRGGKPVLWVSAREPLRERADRSAAGCRSASRGSGRRRARRTRRSTVSRESGRGRCARSRPRTDGEPAGRRSSSSPTRRHGRSSPTTLRVSLEVVVGSSLSLALTSATPARSVPFEEALHTYFAVSDVRQCRVERPRGHCASSTRPPRARAGRASPRRSSSRPRPIASTSAPTPRSRSRTRRGRGGSSSRRPARARPSCGTRGSAKAKAMPDFGDDEWPGMLCVETANAVEDAVTLAPGASHTMTARSRRSQVRGRGAGPHELGWPPGAALLRARDDLVGPGARHLVVERGRLLRRVEVRG